MELTQPVVANVVGLPLRGRFAAFLESKNPKEFTIFGFGNNLQEAVGVATQSLVNTRRKLEGPDFKGLKKGTVRANLTEVIKAHLIIR